MRQRCGKNGADRRSANAAATSASCASASTGVSALGHLLDGRDTVADGAGLFLAQTRRLHPAICRFTSAMFYEGRLHSLAGLDRQAVLGSSLCPESGLVYAPAPRGAMVRVAQSIVRSLVSANVRWRDAQGNERLIAPSDVMVIAPTNALVSALSNVLKDVLVGTIAQFQGQEAPAVIVLWAPEGPTTYKDFNVATSRSQALCVLVGERGQAAPSRTSTRLAAAVHAYIQMAKVIDVTPEFEHAE